MNVRFPALSLAAAFGALLFAVALVATPAEAGPLGCIDQVRIVPPMGPACQLPDGTWQMFSRDGLPAGQTHGPDPIRDDGTAGSDRPTGVFGPPVDMNGDGLPEQRRQPYCASTVGDASVSDPKYMQIIYARAAGDSSNSFSTEIDAVRGTREQIQYASAMIHWEAVSQGREVDYKVKCIKASDDKTVDGVTLIGCAAGEDEPEDWGSEEDTAGTANERCIHVAYRILPGQPSDYNNMDLIANCLRGSTCGSTDVNGQPLNFNNHLVKYQVYWDDPAACSCGGIATRPADDDPGMTNLNNGNHPAGWGALYAINYAAGVSTFMHELGHNMGATQNAAPDSNMAGHCNDEQDIMCYYEDAPTAGPDEDPDVHYQGPPANQPMDCNTTSDPDEWNHFDCGHDTYFNVAIPYVPIATPDGYELDSSYAVPAAWDYIAHKWNIGAPYNQYLYFGNAVPNVAPESYSMYEDAAAIPTTETGLTTLAGALPTDPRYLSVPATQGVLTRGLDSDPEEAPITAQPTLPFTGASGSLTGLPRNTAATFAPFASVDPTTVDLEGDDAFVAFTLRQDGSFQYAPAANFEGTATFKYVVHDGEVASIPVTATITVLPVNDPPVFNLNALASAGTGGFVRQEDSTLAAPLVFTTGTLNPGAMPYENTQVVAFEVASYDAAIFDSVTVAISGGAGTLDFTLKPNAWTDPAGTPAASQVGTLVCVRLTDDAGTANGGDDESEAQCINVIVLEVNDAPATVPDVFEVCDNFLAADQDPMDAVTNDRLANVAVGAADATVNVAVEPELSLVSVTASTLGGTLVVNSDTDIRFDSTGIAAPATGTFTYTVRDRASGPSTTTTETATLQVIPCDLWPYNDPFNAPFDTTPDLGGSDILYEMTEDDAFGLSVPGGFDATLGKGRQGSILENDRLRIFGFPGGADSTITKFSVEVTDWPDHGSLDIVAPADDFANVDMSTLGAFTYLPDNNFSGTDTFMYRLLDVTNDAVNLVSRNVTVSIVVLPVNDAPAAYSTTVVTGEDEQVVLDLASLTFDADLDLLAFEVVQTAGLILAEDLEGSLSGTAPILYFQPVVDTSGTTKLAFRVTDDAPLPLSSAWAYITIVVLPENDPPRAEADSYLARPGFALGVPATIGVLANDYDPEDDAIKASLVQAPDRGTVQFFDDGSFHYIPHDGKTGPDTFVYSASDGLISDNALVTIDVVGNLPPVASFVPQPKQLTYGENFRFVDHSSDADGDIVAWSWTFGDGATSTATSPSHPYAAPGYYYVTLVVTDDEGATGTATVRVTVIEPRSATDLGGTGTTTGNAGAGGGSAARPVADAGLDRTVADDGVVEHVGLSPSPGIIGWRWEQVGEAPALDVSLTEGAQLAFVAPDLQPGEAVVYEFSLVVFDGRLESLPDTVRITVAAGQPAPPTVEAGPARQARSGDAVALQATTTGFPAEAAPTLTWTQVSGRSVGLAGNAFVAPAVLESTELVFEVTARAGDLVSAPDRLTITVMPPLDPPSVEYLKGRLDKAGLVAFQAIPGGLDVVSVRWDFGDGTNSTELQPVHSYTKSGTYTVTLTVTSSTGQTQTIQEPVTVSLRSRGTADAQKDSPGVELAFLALVGLGAAFVARRRE